MPFERLSIIAPLRRALTREGYTEPTPIQAKAIPHLLKGRDLMGIAQTGTGKTAAFVLPILQRMSEETKAPAPGYPRVLVLAPTRELAAQIGESFATYGQFLRFRHVVIFGGLNQGPQVRELSRGIDILVATPGRLLDLMNQGYVHLKAVEYFVIDEADRMLDMGFINDVRRIVSALPGKRHSLFFSATMSPQVGELADTMLKDPVHAEAAPQATTVELVKQSVFFVDQANKEHLLVELIKQHHMTCALIFTRTKHRANKVALMLNKNNIQADAIHGNKSQTQRTRTLQNFKSGISRVLVATDIAARGLDIESISHVINYDMPVESESYVHRIGRTARAGAEGNAYSFCAADERSFLHEIERLIRMKIEVATHRYHSEQARNAVGAAARPAPKQARNAFGAARPVPKLARATERSFKPHW
ncbi:MAG: DEAD/DEAH box helicase [Candidatus Eremiobacteraeota bacterium]|nr:DEAD/DEAH box helicase [Candidatus Eremiobacteraeota bacterium]